MVLTEHVPRSRELVLDLVSTSADGPGAILAPGLGRQQRHLAGRRDDGELQLVLRQG